MFYTMTLRGRYWNRMETKRNWQNASSRTQWKLTEHTGNYGIVQELGLVNLPSYPCRHIHASDLWCQRRRDVITLRLGTTPYHGRSGDLRRVH